MILRRVSGLINILLLSLFAFWEVSRLPRRIRFERCSGYEAHATCYIQVILQGDAASGTVSMSEIDHAASELWSRCAFRENAGGIATNIGSSPIHSGFSILILEIAGGDGNLAVVMGTYQPSIRCRGDLPGWRSCPPIVHSMEATQQSKLFSLPPNPARDETLPCIIRSGTEVP